MVSKRLGEYIHIKGISIYAFENVIGASRGSISKAIKDNKNIGSNVLENILIHFSDLNSTWLMTGKGDMFISESDFTSESSLVYKLKTDNVINGNQKIPLYDIEAVAGLVPLFQDSKEHEAIDQISIPRLPKCDGAIYVTGDSMYPLLKSGDIIMYKQIHDIGNDIFWGEMYLLSIETEDEEYISVKYIQKSEKGEEYVKLVSQNKHHQDRDILRSRIKALALVKASVRINSMS